MLGVGASAGTILAAVRAGVKQKEEVALQHPEFGSGLALSVVRACLLSGPDFLDFGVAIGREPLEISPELGFALGDLRRIEDREHG